MMRVGNRIGRAAARSAQLAIRVCGVRRAGACLVLAVALFTACTGSATANGIKAATFTLVVTGAQSSSWAQDEMFVTDSDTGCGDHTVRNGTERIAFATPRPITVRATPYRYGGFTIPRFASSAGRESIQVQATVDRAETDNSIDTCTGMPIAPNPPLDCGRRQLPWFLTLAPAYRRAGGIWLGTDTRHQQDDPFHACYATLFTWPTIQDHDPNGDRTWFGAVPNKQFFSARARRITVHAHYTATAQGTNLTNGLKSAGVQLDWTLVFTRVR
jgi:hypothetical protein